MKLAERAEHIHKFIEEQCKPLLDVKGKEYSGEEDALNNFKLIGRLIQWALSQGGHSVPLETCEGLVLMTYKLKHTLAILTYFAQGKTTSDETITGRIADDVNYGLLADCLIADINAGAT